MRSAPQWVVSNSKAEPLDVVYRHLVDPTNPTSWGTFEQAVEAACPYVGFCLSHADPYTIIDLDDKEHKPATEEQKAFFQQLIAAFGSYTEISRSGRGYHIVVRGKIPAGRRSDKHRIEVYSADRFFVMTGNVYNGLTEIVDGQKGIDWLIANVLDATIPGQHSFELDTCEDQPDTDQELLNKMCAASNGEKVRMLWEGKWRELGYNSNQSGTHSSEADLALMDILCHYSPNDAQCRRMFRFSALGQRDKAKRDNYLNYMLRKKRVEQIPVDVSMLLPMLNKPTVATLEEDFKPTEPPPVKKRETTQGVVQETFAPGALGWLQWYSYCSAERPAIEISLAAALGFLAGVMGRSYNCMGTGLNQYLLLLGTTGVGKDELSKFQERVISQVRDSIPSVVEYRGPMRFASGQALIKQLGVHPCFCSVLPEFGHTIKELSSPSASSASLILRQTLLLLYGCSGSEGSLQPMVYSEADKSTKEVRSPALTILGETVPESFFEAMSAEQVENGLLPRFLTIDYRGSRPPANPNSGAKMPIEMRNWLIELISVCLAQSQRGAPIQVEMDEDASLILAKRGSYDTQCDYRINQAEGETVRQLWNRAHLKAVRLAALVAAATNPHKPVITREFATWACDLVTKDIKAMIGRFEEGVGTGDVRQLADLRRCLWHFKESDPAQLAQMYRLSEAVVKSGYIPFSYIQRRTANLASFRTDSRGGRVALQHALATLIETGEIGEVGKDRAVALGTTGRLFMCNFG